MKARVRVTNLTPGSDNQKPIDDSRYGPCNQSDTRECQPWQTAHRVSGLMLANHTSIRHLFNKCLTQYDKLMRRKAFLDQYEQHSIFADGLEARLALTTECHSTG
jgi:hypothetical protein